MLYMTRRFQNPTQDAMAPSALLFLVTFLGAGATLALQADNKIVGGQKVNISSVPWQVALDAGGLCGGIIISPDWILTAAHCIKHRDTSRIIARVGSNKFTGGGKIYQIEKLVQHEEFVNFKKHDISLLKTKSPIEFSDNVAAALLPETNDDPLDVGTVLTVSGWGRFDHTDNISHVLLAVDVELLDFATCEKRFHKYHPDKNLQLCAASDGRSSCNGDSGGPLVHGKRVVGIVSYGDRANCGHEPAVYTKVSGYRGWIKDKTGL